MMLTTLAPPLTGLSFDVPDLLIAQAWAAFHGLHMAVHLDRGEGSAQADEVLVFRVGDAGPVLWQAWRDGETVNVQPPCGDAQRFERLADALPILIPEAEPELNDAVGLPPL